MNSVKMAIGSSDRQIPKKPTILPRPFSAHFGFDGETCERAWRMIKQNNNGLKPFHLLWGLMMLKIYATESVLSSMCCVTEKNIPKMELDCDI